MTADNATNAGRRVAVIGLGSMGYGMAVSLKRAGFDVVGFDVRQESVERFVAEGGMGAATPGEAAAGAAAVVCVVLNAEQTEAVLFGEGGCAATMDEGTVFVSSATMAPSVARSLAERLEKDGRHYLDAPISGGAQRAATGELTVLVSGTPAAMAAADAVVGAMAAKVFHLGDAPGTAAGLKIVNQLLAGVHIAAACEAMSFADAHDLDPAKVFEVITASAGNSWMFENRVPHILDNDYTPRSAVDIFVKDLGIVLDIARSEKIPVPLAGTALQSFLMTSAAGMGRDDDASVFRLYQRIRDVADDAPDGEGPS
ncbi:L-threonate dehydrogenase [Bauldia litoralis]|uniref:L-threonate dehydrogenase n=1 Tax=Bauldia litoralis TaxID=665467 RepID=A0A1G6CBM7_9HYPH|nr:L-threonate dehydrogenase [Bauldia litoralis]SDB30280.1 3-hydroxyisobutyrate dehydrogenase [Bauldia litoralis]